MVFPEWILCTILKIRMLLEPDDVHYTSRMVATETGRELPNMSAPGTLLWAQIQLKNATF